MKNTKNKICVLLVLIVLAVLTAAVPASAVPLSESYGYNYNGWDSWTPINNLTDGINKSIGEMGYDAKKWYRTSAYYVRRTMGQDAIFLIMNHANSGFVACENAGTVTYLSANSTPLSYAYSLQNKFQGTTELYDLRFAAFVGCNTALTDTTGNGFGNLRDMASSLGVDTVMAFTNTIDYNQANFFMKRFYAYANNGMTINDAYYAALNECTGIWHELEDVAKYASLLGYPQDTLDPAAYGVH